MLRCALPVLVGLREHHQTGGAKAHQRDCRTDDRENLALGDRAEAEQDRAGRETERPRGLHDPGLVETKRQNHHPGHERPRQDEQPDQGHAAADMAELHLALTEHVHEAKDRRHEEHEARHEQYLLDLARVRVADLPDHVRMLGDTDLRLEHHRQQQRQRTEHHADARHHLPEVVGVGKTAHRVPPFRDTTLDHVRLVTRFRGVRYKSCVEHSS